jgi:hypothetical protein
MPTFETLPNFEQDWQQLTREQQATFRKVVLEAFAPDLITPDKPFRPELRVREVPGHAGVFEMSWDEDGRATFTYGPEHAPGQPHVIWRQIALVTPRTDPPYPTRQRSRLGPSGS